jgi:predicted PurR-regulated permease PerM
MKDKLSVIVGGILILALIFGIAYGGWQLKRWVNWKFGYESQVQIEIEPLKKEIQDLKERVEKLEKAK